MDHLLNDDQRAAYQAFALNHSHHGGWRPLHLDDGTAVSTCSTCSATFGLGPIGQLLDDRDRPGIIVVPDELLKGMTHEQAQALLDDPDMAFSAGVRWAVDEAAHGPLVRPSLGGRIAGTGAWVLDDLGMPDGVDAVTHEGMQYRPALRDGSGGCWASWLNLPELASLRDQLDAGARALSSASGRVKAVLTEQGQDDIYGVLHAIREAFCLAQHHLPPGQAERIDRLIRDVDRLGSQYSLPGQWSNDARTHLDPELPDQVRLEMSQAREAAWARRDANPVREHLMRLVDAVATSNLAVTPDVNLAAQDAVRYLAKIAAPDTTGTWPPPGSTARLYRETRLADAIDMLVAEPATVEELVLDPIGVDQAQRDLAAGISMQVEAMHLALNHGLDTIDGAYTGLAASKVVRALDDLGWQLTPQVHVAAIEPAEILTELLGGDMATSLDLVHQLAQRGWSLVDERDRTEAAEPGPEPGDDRAVAEAYVAVDRDPAEALGYGRVEAVRLSLQAITSGAGVQEVLAGARMIEAYRDGPAEPGAFLPLDALEQLTAHLQGEANDVTHECHEALIVARAHARREADPGRF